MHNRVTKLSLKFYINDKGEKIISNDEKIIALAEGIELPVIPSYKVDADLLAKAFTKVNGTKSPVDAAAYVAVKNEFMKMGSK